MRPQSAANQEYTASVLRPFSANSRQDSITNLSSRKRVSYTDKIQGMVKQGRGLGFFGDANDRLKQLKEQKETNAAIKVTSFTAKTDYSGKADFKDVPTGLYTIEVSGSDKFSQQVREINVVNDQDTDHVMLYVCMKPRPSPTVFFNFYSVSATG